MSEVVINGCYGGFNLSHPAVLAYAERKGIKLYPEPDEIGVKIWGRPDDLAEYKGIVHYYKVPHEQYKALYDEIQASGENYKRLNDQDWYFSVSDIDRDDPDLVAVVRNLGAAANGQHSDLRVVEVPDDVEWYVDEYDGLEQIRENHRTWA
jgi:hypothetical protein